MSTKHSRRKESQSVQATLRDCFSHWKTLYRTRLDVINSLFFGYGNGYVWHDGALVNCEPNAYLEEPARRADELEEYSKDPKLAGILKDKLAHYAKVDALPEGPVKGPMRGMCLMSKYSHIMYVPDNVRPDWLAFAYDAAHVLCNLPKPRHAKGTGFRLAHERLAEILGERPMKKATWDARELAKQKAADKEVEENRKLGRQLVADLERRFPQLRHP